MINRIAAILMFVVLLLSSTNTVMAREMKPGEFLVLCYHAVPLKPAPDDSFSISQKLFVEQMEYLRTHGYHPVSFEDVLHARNGKKPLPGKPVLLTFDDAYISYYEFVAPLLDELGFPSVLAVVGNYIANTPEEGFPEPLMSWDQIREVGKHPLVEVVSHTYDLHRGIQYNIQGNVAPAVNVLAYDPAARKYETEDTYRTRLEKDFDEQRKMFKKELGSIPNVIVWPFGKFNAVSVDIAADKGFAYTFTLEEGYAHISSLSEVRRNLIENVPIEEFIKMVKSPEGEKTMIRAVQVDLDLIYDRDMKTMDQNLGRLIDRLYEMKVNTVFLQAFADPEGTGNIESVYFHNRVLPVRADFFSHAAHQMMIRDMTVYAWMPTLSIELPDKKVNEQLKVREHDGNKTIPSTSWYRRLTPFSSETRSIVGALYEDLASHSQINGILFQDDAYLTDMEDFHPSAVARYKEKFGRDMQSVNLEEERELARSWARYKTEVIIDYLNSMKSKVRKFRPVAKFARNLYAPVLENPESEEWFAQDYGLFLKHYDHVVVMAYSKMEEVKSPSRWLGRLVAGARNYPQGIENTIFKIQSYDWGKEVWIKDRVMLEELRDVLSAGGRHIAYYPDNYRTDEPKLSVIKLEMSTRNFPFLP